MKMIILLLSLVLSPNTFATISEVSTGNLIEASKLNEIIQTVNQTSEQTSSDGVFVATGTIIQVAPLDCPAGYLKADGSAVSRTGVNANLFSAIGTSFGVGDGSTTFNLPSTIRCTSELDCENEFTVKVSSSGAVTGENLNWFNGNFTNSSPAAGTFTLNVFTEAPNCVPGQGASAHSIVNISSISHTSIGVQFNGNVKSPFQLNCQKATADFKPLSKMPSMFTKCIKL